ncbi:MAG: hypothetical protein WDA27_04000 [Actinomycetota bacterium]
MPQGTIKSFDSATRTGILIDDSGIETGFDFDSYRDAGARLFRLGQRVKFQVIGEGRRIKVRDLTVITL